MKQCIPKIMISMFFKFSDLKKNIYIYKNQKKNQLNYLYTSIMSMIWGWLKVSTALGHMFILSAQR